MTSYSGNNAEEQDVQFNANDGVIQSELSIIGSRKWSAFHQISAFTGDRGLQMMDH